MDMALPRSAVTQALYSPFVRSLKRMLQFVQHEPLGPSGSAAKPQSTMN